MVTGQEILEGGQKILERGMPYETKLDTVDTRGVKQPKEQLT